MTHSFRFIIFAGLTSLLACGEDQQNNNNASQAVDNDTAYIETFSAITLPSSISTTDIASVAQDLLSYAFDQYQHFSLADKNFINTPFDQQRVFAMAALGADGDTLTGMSTAFHLDFSEISTHQALSGLGQMIDNSVAIDRKSTLTGQTHYRFAKSYLQNQVEIYGPELAGADYVSSYELTGTGLIPSNTRLTIDQESNLDTTWPTDTLSINQFTGRFLNRDSDEQIWWEMLAIEGVLNTKDTETYQAVEIPLGAPELALLLIMPRPGFFDEIRTGFTPDFYTSVLSELTPTPVKVALPLFDIEKYSDAAGIPDLGSAMVEFEADFSRVNLLGYLYLAPIKYKISFHLTTQGVVTDSSIRIKHEATADEPPTLFNPPYGSGDNTSGFVMRDIYTPQPVPCYYAPDQHPFLFVTLHRATGTVLNIGHVTTLNGMTIPPDWTVDYGSTCDLLPPV